MGRNRQLEVASVELFDTTQAILEQGMVGSSLRNRAIANNIANVNTPDFKRSDVDFTGALHDAVGKADSTQQIEDVTFTPETDTTTATRADGNNVDIDTEMANLNENVSTYQALEAIVRARFHMLEIAMGK
jgi:flagellar basal-body rod protein FlgB